MSYKTKPIIKLYKYENNTFKLQAMIDDFQECSFEHNLYEAGTFTISINYNIPNSQLFQRGMFVQFGNSYNFGEIVSISDKIGEDGKGSQIRTIIGKDARYILHRRVIKNMNSNGLWVMTGKGEIVLRNLINDQCGTNAEVKRKLPINNTIPAVENAIGNTYSVSEQFTNLYEVCKTIATQSGIGWRIEFDGVSLNLVCYSGEDKSQTVRFDTDYESLADGNFTDSSEAFSNAIYVGGKGQNDDRDIYEGENGTPSGLDRFECWDNQSSMTTESEYAAEALSMLSQYGQTITLSGKGLAKCPYIFQEQYNVGDIITVAFSGKSAMVQILAVTEHWSWNKYDMEFSFGKPQPTQSDQLQLMLRKIQEASNKTNSKDSVRWYTIPTDTEMPAADVTYNTIGFVGDVGSSGATFKLYRDASGTGSKTYHIRFKQLAGTGKLTLTTGVSGASNLVMNSGTYVAIIYVDADGNVSTQGATPSTSITSGNTQPAQAGAVAEALQSNYRYHIPSPSGSTKYYRVHSNTSGYINIMFVSRYGAKVYFIGQDGYTRGYRLTTSVYGISGAKTGYADSHGDIYLKLTGYNPFTIINLDKETDNQLTITATDETTYNSITSSVLTNYVEYGSGGSIPYYVPSSTNLFVPKRTNGYLYNPAIGTYWGSTGGKYFRIKIPKGSATWCMAHLEVSLRTYNPNTSGKILIHANWSYASEWNEFKYSVYGDLSLSNVKVYGSDKQYIYIYTNTTYTTCSLDKVLFGDNITRQDVSAMTIDSVSSLPATYQTATLVGDIGVSYSTTEQLTGGTWVDGKPIYRRVITGTWADDGSVTLDVPFSDTNISQWINVIATLKDPNGFVPVYYQVDTDYFNLYFTTGANPKFVLRRGATAPKLPATYIIIVEYTKI